MFIHAACVNQYLIQSGPCFLYFASMIFTDEGMSGNLSTSPSA